jgi:hypothetical protein
VTKAIAITQQGEKTVFLLGDYQAHLIPPSRTSTWRAEYFKKNRVVLMSSSDDHPPMPLKLRGRVAAETIVKKMITCLDSGTPFPRVIPGPKPTPKKPTRKRPQVVGAYQVLDRLLNLVDDTCTVLVPMGKPAALMLSKVRIVDSEGEAICEIPYSIFQSLL